MTYFNPLIAPVAQSPQAQRVAAADKERQVARAQALAKNSAAEGDHFEHTVESPDAVTPAGDETPQGGGGKERQGQKKKESEGDRGADARPRLDVTG